ncbi:MAG TPA: SDR family oxidoreductase [Burkholderiales bacterium]|jgi:3-oxoacyl-[acyl-carrier protein] reductase|nr:SDR family oxidoreductase [Burkholderiales bacterium]
MELGLKNRRAIISGANRGIGRTIALAFAQEGMHVALLGRNAKECAELADEILAKGSGVKAVAVTMDLEQPETIPPAVEQAVSALGGVDVLVNCAGGAYRGRLAEIPDEMWERYFKVKPLGLIRMTRAAFPHLKKSEQGRVINISGTRGREPEAHSMMSGPINFGTLSVTKALANEFGPFGITVNAIAPGSTRTRRWDELVSITARERKTDEKEAEAHLLREVPLGKVIEPEDVANLALFLASARSGNISGTAINVDGGRTRSI